jgi:hypothetical protein
MSWHPRAVVSVAVLPRLGWVMPERLAGSGAQWLCQIAETVANPP